MDTITAAGTHESKGRDDYGRPVVHVYYGKHLYDGPAEAVMVTLPKAYYERTGSRYLVNVWGDRQDGRTPVSYFAKRNDALAFARNEATRLGQLRKGA